MRRTRVLGGGVLGALGVVGALSSACSSDPVAGAAKERLGTSRQAVAGATKVCQLIGDVDFQTGTATKSLTKTRYGVSGTDLGYPVFDTTRNMIWFLFGDMFPSWVDHVENLPGSSATVLLLYGTGQPLGSSGVYLAAVRMDQLTTRSSWRFIDASGLWSPSSLAARPLFPEKPQLENPPAGSTGCAGEISVSYNTTARTACSRRTTSGTPSRETTRSAAPGRRRRRCARGSVA